MNSKYREFMQRQSVTNSMNNSSGDDTMRQLFGDSPDNPNNQNETYKNTKKSKKKFNIENLPIPIKEGMAFRGFIAVGILFIIEAIIMMVSMKFMYFMGALILSALSFLIAWKVKYRYTERTNYFVYNFTVTLKGVVNDNRTTSILMEASEKLFIYSIFLMAIQHFLLSWFSLTSILYSIGYYGMYLGIILNLAKRKTELLSKGMFLYSLLLALMTIQNVVFSQYINYHTSISLFVFLYLAGLFQSIKIRKVDIDNKADTVETNKETEEVEDIEIEFDELI